MSYMIPQLIYFIGKKRIKSGSAVAAAQNDAM